VLGFLLFLFTLSNTRYVRKLLIYNTLSIFCYVLLAYFVPRTNFWETYALFLIVAILWFQISNQNFENKHIFWMGILFRLVFLAAIPALSDDFYRFLWDGNLMVDGINPYTYKPAEIQQNMRFSFLFSKLNSQEYYSVYPTVIQLINYISVKIGQSFFWSIFVMKFLFLCADLGVFYGLKFLKTKEKYLSFYWLCPLVIIEFVGNLHHEVWMILCMLWTIYFFRQNRFGWAYFLLSLAIFTKLIPLLFLPFFLLKTPKENWLKSIYILLIINTLLLLLVCIDDGYLHLFESIKLYFGSFEFNSSLYKIVDFISWKFPNIKIIYKLLTIIVLGVYFWHWKSNKLSLEAGIFAFQLIYLLSAQSVHPWYLIPLFVWAICQNKLPKYLFFWLILIPLTYISYQTYPYQQNLWAIGFEYGVVFLLFYLSLTKKFNC
jgi:alpha-1,6-mannosyltransferase